MAFSEFFSFLSILKESLILLPKNGKLMAFIAICSIVLYSALFLLFNCSLQSLSSDIIATVLKPNPSAHIDQLKECIALLIADNITYVLSTFVISFFLGLSTIIVSATSYTEVTLSFNNLFSLIGKTCMRTLIVALYVAGLAIGYFSCVLMLAAPLLIMYPNLIVISFAAVFGIAAYVLYIYLYVTWGLAIVVSVVEGNGFGVHALERASALVKGKRVQGFMLIVCFSIMMSIVSMGIGMVFGNKGILGNTMVYGVLMMSFSSLMKIWGVSAYTVLYFECKKHHGEELEHGSVQYVKLPTAVLAADMA